MCGGVEENRNLGVFEPLHGLVASRLGHERLEDQEPAINKEYQAYLRFSLSEDGRVQCARSSLHSNINALPEWTARGVGVWLIAALADHSGDPSSVVSAVALSLRRHELWLKLSWISRSSRKGVWLPSVEDVERKCIHIPEHSRVIVQKAIVLQPSRVLLLPWISSFSCQYSFRRIHPRDPNPSMRSNVPALFDK